MKVHSLLAALAIIFAPVVAFSHDDHSSNRVSSITVYRISTAVTTGALNLREGPGTSYRAISVLHRNTTVHVHGCSASGYWCNVSSATATGWVSARYLTQTPAPAPAPWYGGTWTYPYTSVVPYPYMTMPRAPGTSTFIYTQP